MRKILCSKNDFKKPLERSSLQCRRILGGRNFDRVRNVVVAAILFFLILIQYLSKGIQFSRDSLNDFMTVEDWGE